MKSAAVRAVDLIGMEFLSMGQSAGKCSWSGQDEVERQAQSMRLSFIKVTHDLNLLGEKVFQ